ncbi:MAG TPA: peptidoglycan-binding protein [Bryobacteraceae bacterium]|nr:peptidoglycan-binding protein [Bryobacteraceae bacterium]
MADPVLKLGDSGPSVAEAQDLLNRTGAILDPDGAFGNGTDAAVREFQAGAVPSLPVTGIIDSVTWQALRALPEPSPDMPVRAVAFIGREEVGSRELYDKLACRPAWPGGASGVTIGVGYDLGQQSSFEDDWSAVLTPAQVAALRPWLQVRGAAASGGPAALKNLTIPWPAAWQVFLRRTLPDQVRTTRTAFNGWQAMPRLCFGALVSLVYNRGSRMTDSPTAPGDRTEMRAIRDAVAAGQFAAIPAQLRSMERLWPVGNGLRDRREREAKLFELGLSQG